MDVPKEELTESMEINQENKAYLLVIKMNEEIMTLTLKKLKEIGHFSYSRKLCLKDLKEIHKSFIGFNSLKEFSIFLKKLWEMKKIIIDEKNDELCINFEIEYLLKKENIEIILYPTKINNESLIIELCKEINLIKEKNNNNDNIIYKLNNENKELKKDIENFKKENTKLKEEIKQIKNILEPINKNFQKKKSVIMEENEFDFIREEIETKLKNKIKKIKKLYQATTDGLSAINFHSKCDNKSNTLTLIKSEGNRRFGGFVAQVWDSSGWKKDENAFLFSLDKKKIYKIKPNAPAIWCDKSYGPNFGHNSGGIFGNSHDICMAFKPFAHIHTYEFSPNSSYDFSGDNDALSECGRLQKSVTISEFEVFQIIV